MKALQTWLLCLLLLFLALKGAAGQAHQHPMEIRTPDIDPAWYTGRRIRPVGRFGRRRAALRDVAKPSLWGQPACFPLQGDAEPAQDG